MSINLCFDEKGERRCNDCPSNNTDENAITNCMIVNYHLMASIEERKYFDELQIELEEERED
jgi:hypothetical protein